MVATNYAVVIPCQWERVELVRCAVGACLRAAGLVPAICDAVAMASAELLDNAIKHGGDRAGEVRFSLETADTGITVRVTNPSPERTPSVDQLVQNIDWLNKFDNPQEAYIHKLTEAVDSDGGGLGLARVAYEGSAHLSYAICPTSVEVEATFVAFGAPDG